MVGLEFFSKAGGQSGFVSCGHVDIREQEPNLKFFIILFCNSLQFYNKLFSDYYELTINRTETKS